MGFSERQKKWLTGLVGPRAVFDEPMKRHTSFRVGGKAEALVIAADVSELVQLLSFSRDSGQPYFVIGAGTNLLVRDEGIRGLVIAVTKAMGKIDREPENGTDVIVNAMAGASLKSLCRYAADAGLSGINFATGIPGTVGGALRMNAGTTAGAVGDIVIGITALLPGGEIRMLTRESLGFAYRRMQWPAGCMGKESASPPIIIDARFRLVPGDSTAIKAEAKALWTERKRKQPLNRPSAGCIFKNPSPETPAGMLIEKAGLKGKQSGGARVSDLHANFIVNEGDASAADILRLMEIVQETVWKRYNIRLEPEVQIVG
ncbi:MAG: UDP-N-acetylmuramate dehydrogenase [Thermodesulfobacteriota bacterium]